MWRRTWVTCVGDSGRPLRKAPKGEDSSCSRQDLWVQEQS